MHILSKNKLPIATLCAAIILRFYKIGAFTIFLSDQGRDAIIVKRIVTFEHLPAIGPPTSIGHIFLGPFYYYLISPFLFLAKLNPIGMSVGVALLSILGLIGSYLIVKKETSKAVANIFLILATFSFINIDYSRFSWNPNPLPYFSFITLFFASQTFKTKNLFIAFLLGSFLALSVQLHYLAFLIVIPIGLAALYFLIRDSQKLKLLVSIAAAFAGFGLFSSPLIIFDLKHGFINSKNLLALFQKESVISHSSFFSRFQDTTSSFFTHLVQLNVTHTIGITSLVLLGLLYVLTQRHKMKIFDVLQISNIFIYLLGFSLLESFRHPHYYMSVYFSFFFIAALLIFELFHRKPIVYRIIGIGIVVLFIGVNARKYYYFTQEPNNQVKHAQTVANYMAPLINKKPFNIATWPIDFTEDTYLYFLELKGLKPADREKSEVTEQMFVLCNSSTCSIINSPSWNINMFGPAKVAGKWEIERIKIYKLSHVN